MLSALKTKFARYFMLKSKPSLSSIISATFYSKSKARNEVSEILKDRLYLSNLPTQTPFTNPKPSNAPALPNSALVMSCLDFSEITKSSLLLEPESKSIQYHVLAMEDETAQVGSNEQIHEALDLMSSYAEQKKPIHVHCLFGVGRSAMMMALHIAHRYLLGDETIKTIIDKEEKLDPTSMHYVKQLYMTATQFVLKKRPCCQFKSTRRTDRALTVLYEIHQNLKAKQTLINKLDENHLFLSSLVQSAPYKKLIHYLFNSASAETRTPFELYFNSLALNKEDWYQKLSDAVNTVPPQLNESNFLYEFCKAKTNQEEKSEALPNTRRSLLGNLLEIINHLSLSYPNAVYGAPARLATTAAEIEVEYVCNL